MSPEAGIPIGLSPVQLQAIMPQLPGQKVLAHLPLLQAAMDEFAISFTRYRMAAYLAQIAHESAELRFLEEIASGAAYEGRSDLGNNEPGDGLKYKGRSPIQLTGKRNYDVAGRLLGLDLVGDPSLAAVPANGHRIAGAFWHYKELNRWGDLNELADTEQFLRITEVINGGHNGQSHREAYYVRARRVLGIP